MGRFARLDLAGVPLVMAAPCLVKVLLRFGSWWNVVCIVEKNAWIHRVMA